MPFTDVAPPPEKPKPGTGISFGLRIDKRKRGTVRITFTEERQEYLFGGPIAGKRFSAQAGRGADEGKLRVVVDGDGALEAKAGIKGSASLTMSAWDLLPKDKRPAAPCEIDAVPKAGEVILSLPPFCRPNGVGGKIESEFGIRKGAPAKRA